MFHRSVCIVPFGRIFCNSLTYRQFGIICFLIVQIVYQSNGLDVLPRKYSATPVTISNKQQQRQPASLFSKHHHYHHHQQQQQLKYPNRLRSLSDISIPFTNSTLHQWKHNQTLLHAVSNRSVIKNKSFVNYGNSTLVPDNLHRHQLLAPPSSPSIESNGRTSRSIDYDFNRNYFEQLNAHNHKPISADPMIAQESETKITRDIANAAPENKYQGRSNQNVMYYSPNSYAKTTPVTMRSKNSETQLPFYSYIYPNTTPTNTMAMASSADNLNLQHSTNNGSTSDSHSTANQINQKLNSIWSASYNENKDSGQKRYNPQERNDYPFSYSGELNKKLLDKYYSQDLSSMTALLSKHPSSASEHMASNNGHKRHSSESVDTTNEDENDEDNNDEDDAPTEDNPDKEHDGIAYYNKQDTNVNRNDNNYLEYATLKNSKFNDHLLSDYKGSARSGETVYRLHSPGKMMRQYTGRSSIPIRYQTAHTHSVPQMSHYGYSMPHTGMESDFHHHLGSEKSNTWLGSGLAAGILIGAIPFGIMMASMMPTLITGAMPIVNTAAVGRRRRRRSTDIKNHFLDQTLDTLGVLLRKGFTEFISLSGNQNNNYMPKNSVVNDYNLEDDPAKEVLKMVTKYALAAVDEPKCIKEMLCSLVASGKNPKTTALQKALYLLVKWVPKDIERSLGLNGLFGAVRKNTCFATYKCPSTILSAMQKRSRTAETNPINTRKMS